MKVVGAKGASLGFEAGRLAAARGQIAEAARCFLAAFRADPNFLDARLAFARLMAQSNDFIQAEKAYDAILKRWPYAVPALRELAWVYGAQQKFRLTMPLIDRLLDLGEDVAHELAETAGGLGHICDWSLHDHILKTLIAIFEAGVPCLVNPYVLFSMSDAPTDHMKMAKCIAAALSAGRDPIAAPRRISRPDTERYKIGYLCGDFSNHSTSYLLAGVIECHDRSRFDITLYDYSVDDESEARQRVLRAFETVVPLGDDGPVESAARIAADGIDILIDLNGYTPGSRSEIMISRPAPVQVSFLGYVGTQGGDWIDYIVADQHVLPIAEQKHWPERFVYMPFSYYPGDRTRPIPGDRTPEGRTQHGLPQDCFVFACFNNSYKITPEIFALWMKILVAVPNSVLWLYESNNLVAANLRAEAKRAEIDPSRLVFGKPLARAEHIERHAYADLFLDTMPYGAHTTGADALWAGLPLIALRGQSFASRVSASLLIAVGLPELICDTPESYVDLAVSLSQDPVRLAEYRARLIDARTQSPLFDAARFAADLERGYLHMAAVNRAGGAVRGFALPADMNAPVVPLESENDTTEISADIPVLSVPDFTGPSYLEVLRDLHIALAPKIYFEIGTAAGDSLLLARCKSIAVDPEFQFDPAQFPLDRSRCSLYEMTSDEFFRTHDPRAVFDRDIDFAFLDGLHICEYLLRDFANTERLCRPASVIALHDCLPVEYLMAGRTWGRTRVEQHRLTWWAGDVWRTALILKRHRPDLHIVAVTAPPTGLVLITNLDPQSDFITTSFDRLHDEMMSLDLRVIGIDGLQRELNALPSERAGSPESIAALLKRA